MNDNLEKEIKSCDEQLRFKWDRAEHLKNKANDSVYSAVFNGALATFFAILEVYCCTVPTIDENTRLGKIMSIGAVGIGFLITTVNTCIQAKNKRKFDEERQKVYDDIHVIEEEKRTLLWQKKDL